MWLCNHLCNANLMPTEWLQIYYSGTTCCCRRILFNQPDFTGVKSHLEEFITVRSHLCDFYPKFHCELNYIEQYWGAIKLLYRSGPRIKKMEDMEKQVAACLDDISLVQIQRYYFWRFFHDFSWIWPKFALHRFSNRSAHFIDAYRKGLNGPQTVWANRKYHGHWMLPNNIMDNLKAAGKT
jgi:hypothetical protein